MGTARGRLLPWMYQRAENPLGTSEESGVKASSSFEPREFTFEREKTPEGTEFGQFCSSRSCRGDGGRWVLCRGVQSPIDPPPPDVPSPRILRAGVKPLAPPCSAARGTRGAAVADATGGRSCPKHQREGTKKGFSDLGSCPPPSAELAAGPGSRGASPPVPVPKTLPGVESSPVPKVFLGSPRFQGGFN